MTATGSETEARTFDHMSPSAATAALVPGLVAIGVRGVGTAPPACAVGAIEYMGTGVGAAGVIRDLPSAVPSASPARIAAATATAASHGLRWCDERPRARRPA